MPNLKTLKQPLPLAKMAYESLRESILKGELAPGEIYNEKGLAKELGISRTPVREALLELSAQGFVTFIPRKGVKVNHYSRRDVEEIFELRMAIELAVMEKVAKLSSSCDLTKLEATLKEQQRAIEKKDYEGFLKADKEFHTTFSELAGNKRFVSILENIRDLYHMMARDALNDEQRWKEVVEEHKQVLQAAREGKASQAKKAMERHLKQSWSAVLKGSSP
jgi:DNA-binding GntR family transcriptional regulator